MCVFIFLFFFKLNLANGQTRLSAPRTIETHLLAAQVKQYKVLKLKVRMKQENQAGLTVSEKDETNQFGANLEKCIETDTKITAMFLNDSMGRIIYIPVLLDFQLCICWRMPAPHSRLSYRA